MSKKRGPKKGHVNHKWMDRFYNENEARKKAQKGYKKPKDWAIKVD